MLATLHFKKLSSIGATYTCDDLEIDLPEEICNNGTEILGETKDGKLLEKKLFHKKLVILTKTHYDSLVKENEQNWRRLNPEGMGR